MSRLTIALMMLVSLASYPLVFANKFGGEWPFLVTIPWAALFVAIWLVRKAMGIGDWGLGNGRFGIWLVLYFATAAVSVVFARQKAFCATALVSLAVNLLLAYAVAASFDSHKNSRLVGVWLAVATGVSVWAMVIHLGAPKSAAEPVVSFGNRNFLAGFLAASVWACLPFARRDEGAGWKIRRVLYCVWVLWLMLVIAVACRSRGAMLALVGVGALLVSLRFRSLLVRFAWVGGVGLAMLVMFDLPAVRVKLAQLTKNDVRPAIWSGTVWMIQERPLTGHGWGSFVAEYPRFRPSRYFSLPLAAVVTDHAHNEFLEIAAEGGLFALWAFAALMIFVAWRGLRAASKGDVFAVGFVGALATLLAQNMVDVNLCSQPNQTVFWLLIGLIVAQNREDAGAATARPYPRALAAAVALAVAVFAVAMPLWADVNFARASKARSRGDWPATVAAYERALQADPFRLKALDRLAFANAQLSVEASARGERERAGKALANAVLGYERLLSLAPDYGDANYNLSRLYLAVGKPRDAVRLLGRAAKLNPYDERVRELLMAARRLLEASSP